MGRGLTVDCQPVAPRPQGLTVHCQPSTTLAQGLAASARLRHAAAQARYARRAPSSFVPLLRACKAARIGLAARLGPCGIAELTITHLERAPARLREALAQHHTAIATVLLLHAGAAGRLGEMINFD